MSNTSSTGSAGSTGSTGSAAPAFRIDNVRIVLPGEGIVQGSVGVLDGKIDTIERADEKPPAGSSAGASAGTATSVIDGRGRLLTPGLIDVHTHGVGTYLYERSAEELVEGGRFLPQFGTTCILPTLYRVMNRPGLKLLERLADTLPKVVGARMPTFHLEGPFLALPGAGAETIPGDLGLLSEVYDACRGRVGAMSISPDTPNILPVIEWLVERGVVPYITHTKANAEQTEAALEAGARHATHFYDVFYPPAETEPGARPVGAVESILADPRATVDFICDGVHVHPTAIRAALAAKGWKGIVLITDSNIGAGMPPGVHDTPWGFPIRVTAGDAARIADPKHQYHGALAGSCLTMDGGIRNLMKWLRLPPEQVWAMGTLNPARLMGWPDRGTIAAGAEADLVLWTDDLKPAMTWVGGELQFSAERG